MVRMSDILEYTIPPTMVQQLPRCNGYMDPSRQIVKLNLQPPPLEQCNSSCHGANRTMSIHGRILNIRAYKTTTSHHLIDKGHQFGSGKPSASRQDVGYQ